MLMNYSGKLTELSQTRAGSGVRRDRPSPFVFTGHHDLNAKDISDFDDDRKLAEGH
jgi:hypothetical protein